MSVALPAALLFGAVTFLLIRARAVRALEAIIVGLFGFTLASSVLGAAIRAFLAALFNYHAVKNGTPTAPPSLPPVTTPGASGNGIPV